jgi:hypothetical protein
MDQLNTIEASQSYAFCFFFWKKKNPFLPLQPLGSTGPKKAMPIPI